MAATAEKALLIDELRRSNGALVEANAELERQYIAVLQARRLKDEFLANISTSCARRSLRCSGTSRSCRKGSPGR